MTHFKPRSDAVWHQGRRYVPTVHGETRWISTWDEFHAAGGVANFSEDQTEIVLTLPEGCKFSIKFPA